MKHLLSLFLVLSLGFAFNVNAQDRVDDRPTELSYKSLPIKNILYWWKENGEWKSRKCNKRVYIGEGKTPAHMELMFIGDYENRRYLFFEKNDYFWRYPVLAMDWSYARTVHNVLLSDATYNDLKNLKQGEVYLLKSDFHNSLSRSHNEYSFQLLLKLSETLRSSSETMYDSYKRDGQYIADAYWKKECPTLIYCVLKRTISNGEDVVRFRLDSVEELIDFDYFEVPYAVWQNLFTSDKTTKFK